MSGEPGTWMSAQHDAPPPLSPPPLRARTLMLGVVTLVALAWTTTILVDGYDLGGLRTSIDDQLWMHLFNDRPIEWLQWFALVTLAVGAAYTAGRLTGTALRRERAFWLLVGVGAGLMLIEDAGDIRHVLSSYTLEWLGREPLGVHYRILTEGPYLAALAAVPVYALLRHGRVLWGHRPVRRYLVTGYGLYALSGAGSAIRHLGDDGDGRGLYSRIGEALHGVLAGGRMPVPEAYDEARFHFLLVDSPVEESLELLAVAGLVAALLAFVASVASGDPAGDRGERAAARPTSGAGVDEGGAGVDADGAAGPSAPEGPPHADSEEPIEGQADMPPRGGAHRRGLTGEDGARPRRGRAPDGLPT